MRNYYEGETKVKQAKIQGFRMQFESLKMYDDEYIANYY